MGKTTYVEAVVKHAKFTNEEERELLVWFKEHRPEMWRDIFCESCPEVC